MRMDVVRHGRLLTVEQIAARLNVHRQTAYRYVASMPTVRLGDANTGLLRVSEADLDAWLAERRTGGEPCQK